ncbi:MAG TPA: phosphate ABC transporter permease subunit PstC [Sandaracinaceae bacterium LLY-WYZ-13_1]|nr:phosphate ABC transporter permease subunit PstC [Sandaracinaceae bacterium LLY-WYZ-13_1]
MSEPSAALREAEAGSQESAADPAAREPASVASAPGPGVPLGQGFRTPLSHRVAERAIAATAFVAIGAIALIFAFIVKEALPLLWETEALEEIGGFGALFSPRQWEGYEQAVYVWQPVGGQPKLNVAPLFVGTLKVTALSMLISVPLGVGSAIFVSQYAPKPVREVVKPALELLASIPSVVLGFFALIVLASWLQDAFGFAYRLNALTASVGMSLAVIPLIFTISEDALRAVPRHLSEASMALGARKWQTTVRVVVPAALPGIAAAIILGFGRAIGETMVVLMASGNAAVMEVFDPTTSVRTVTATIAAELGEVAQGDPHWRVLFLLGVLLFAITFALNRLGAVIIGRLHRRLTAEGGE